MYPSHREAADVTQEVLIALLRYEPDTGLFFWRQTGYGRPKDLTIPAGYVRSGDGYVGITVNYKRQLAHRLAWLYVHGVFPPEDIDHVNLTRTDNRIANLRAATTTQNLANSPGKAKRAGLKGTRRNRKGWQAVISINGKGVPLGTYPTVEEAHSVYLAEARRVFGEFANAGHSSPLA